MKAHYVRDAIARSITKTNSSIIRMHRSGINEFYDKRELSFNPLQRAEELIILASKFLKDDEQKEKADDSSI